MRVVLLGAPGAGKGTVCKSIVDEYGVDHLSSGDILRKERAENSELGQQAQNYMDSGQLVPDDLIVAMMAGAISKASEAGFVLDGFPRTVNQAEKLDETLNANGIEIDAVVCLVIEDEVILERMAGRRSCPQCGAVYHVTNLPPKVEGKCDNDGAELIQRPDDNPEVVKQRLVTYHEQTKPVVGYYKSHGRFYEIESDQGPDNVRAAVLSILEEPVNK